MADCQKALKERDQATMEVMEQAGIQLRQQVLEKFVEKAPSVLPDFYRGPAGSGTDGRLPASPAKHAFCLGEPRQIPAVQPECTSRSALHRQGAEMLGGYIMNAGILQ